MSKKIFGIETARNEVSLHSAGGAPFLIAYGATFLLTALISLFVSLETAGLVAMFQGGLALPAAFWLERRMGRQRMSTDNLLRALSGQLAMSQAAALPAFIIVYNVEPVMLPLLLAAFGGMHFIPYAWLHRTRIYLGLGGILALGSFFLLLQLQSAAFIPTLVFIGVLYWLAAPLVYRHAAKITRPQPVQAAAQH